MYVILCTIWKKGHVKGLELCNFVEEFKCLMKAQTNFNEGKKTFSSSSEPKRPGKWEKKNTRNLTSL